MLGLGVLIAAVVATMFLLAHFLYRGDCDSPSLAPPETTPDPERTGLGEPEWKVVMERQCLPTNCPNLNGNPRRPGKEPGCQVCAALFLEHYGERLVRPQREGRNR